MPEEKANQDAFSELMNAGNSTRRRRRPAGPVTPGKGPSGPAMRGGPSGPAMRGGPSGPAMRGPSGPVASGGMDPRRQRRKRGGSDDLMKQLYG